MLIDTLTHGALYPFGPIWARVFADLLSLVQQGANLAEGSYPLGTCDTGKQDDSRVVATVSVYTSQHKEDKAEGRYETHDVMADIQLVLEGEEDIALVEREGLTAATEYEPARDITFYREKPESAARVRLVPGRFMLALPHDAHMPGLAAHNPARVKKLVVKIPVSALALPLQKKI